MSTNKIAPRMSSEALEAARLLDRLERLSRTGEDRGGLNPAQWEALRYVALANRFSRSPAALADYLGSTRGTVSQTLIALENKGLLSRESSVRDRRSIELVLTERGVTALERDPLHQLATDLAASAGKDMHWLVEILRGAILANIGRNNGKAFGVCRSCRYFGHAESGDSERPHLCRLLNEQLSEPDKVAICAEHAA